MTSKEFILWFGGFVDAVGGIPTQTQWDQLKNKVKSVSDPIPFRFGGPLVEPFIPAKNPINPYNPPYEITCSTGTPTMYPLSNTSTGYGYISGSSVSYTSALDRYSNWYWTLPKPNQQASGSNQLELELEFD